MKKLKIKFWQIENLVIMKVLDQDKKLRGYGEIFRDDYLDMAIYSTSFPVMTNSIFIRGSEKEKDNRVSCTYFNSIKDASDYIGKCQKLINSYNASLEDEEEEV